MHDFPCRANLYMTAVKNKNKCKIDTIFLLQIRSINKE